MKVELFRWPSQIQTLDHDIITDPGPQNTLFSLKIAILLPIIFQIGTNIHFSLANNIYTYFGTGVGGNIKFGFLGAKEYF